jgi:hypothetical protein
MSPPAPPARRAPAAGADAQASEVLGGNDLDASPARLGVAAATLLRWRKQALAAGRPFSDGEQPCGGRGVGQMLEL